MTVSKGFSGNMASVKASQRRAVAQQVLGSENTGGKNSFTL
jgi:hypothetical protein